MRTSTEFTYTSDGVKCSVMSVEAPASGDVCVPMTVTNRWRYAGKEEQTLMGEDMLDFGARFYDPRLGRWTTTDPLAEKYYSVSPYAYCAGNPVMFVDPDGRGVFIGRGGRELGNDGVDDGKRYVLKTTRQSYGSDEQIVQADGIKSKQYRETEKFILENSGNTDAFTKNKSVYENSVEICGSSTAAKMIEVASQDNGMEGTAEQNNREYGGTIAPDGSIEDVRMGPVGSPKTGAYIDLPSKEHTFHTHPSGTEEGRGYAQHPSQDDVNIATGTSYVIGMNYSTVYVYDNRGILCEIPLKHFKR